MMMRMTKKMTIEIIMDEDNDDDDNEMKTIMMTMN